MCAYANRHRTPHHSNVSKVSKHYRIQAVPSPTKHSRPRSGPYSPRGGCGGAAALRRLRFPLNGNPNARQNPRAHNLPNNALQ
jgi:hypothetical protein